MAITEAGLAWCSNSSNSLTSSSRPRFPERKRSAMARSSSKQRSRTRRDMPTGHGTASSPARRRYYLTCCPWTKSFSNLQSTTSNLPKQNKWQTIWRQTRSAEIKNCNLYLSIKILPCAWPSYDGGGWSRAAARFSASLGRRRNRGAGQPGFSVDDDRGRGEPATGKAS